MLTEEDDVEIAALARRGWSVSAIARHTGRDRKTIRKYLKGEKPSGGRLASCVEPFREYLAARFSEDAHVDGTVLFREVVELGFERSYPTFVGSYACWGCGRAVRRAAPAGTASRR